MAKEKQVLSTLERKGHSSFFTLVGRANVNDYTFTIDKQNEKGTFVSSRLNLLVDCGEKYGNIATSMFGGYNIDADNVIYIFPKQKDGSVDYKNRETIAWEDRLDEDVVERAGGNLIKMYLEKDAKGKTITKTFLSPYDAVEYISENLSDGELIRVTGELEFSYYEGRLQINKRVRTIGKIDEPTEDKGVQYQSTFKQSFYITDESTQLTKDYLNVENKTLQVDGYVLGWASKIDGIEVNGNYPYKVVFEAKLSDVLLKDKDKLKKYINKYLKAGKNKVNLVTFNGEFVETGATIKPKYEDIPEDVQELIELGIKSEEEALREITIQGKREQKLILISPAINKKDNNGDTEISVGLVEDIIEPDVLLEVIDTVNSMKESNNIIADEEIESEIDDLLNDEDEKLKAVVEESKVKSTSKTKTTKTKEQPKKVEDVIDEDDEDDFDFGSLFGDDEDSPY